MANRSGAIARFLIKWLVIPVGLAAIGFFVVGPRLGAEGRASAKSETEGHASSTAPNSGGAKVTGNPDVTITSKPISRRRAPRRRSRTEDTTRSTPSREEKGPAEVPSPDEAPPARTGDG